MSNIILFPAYRVASKVAKQQFRTAFENALDDMLAKARTDSERQAIANMRARSRFAHAAARNLARSLAHV
jgi:hypothetical protein